MIKESIIYQPNWKSLDNRPIPTWFDVAKFGIFIHWGIYSVPAWGPKRNSVNTSGEAYAEWYGWAMNQQKSQYQKFHNELYGAHFKYQDFAPLFKAELFDPDKWAEVFAKSGANYVTLTSKHHDGFCLWPSSYSWNWNSVDIGPHRDIVGELACSVQNKGLKMGLYYSLLEWYNPLFIQDPEQYAVKHMIPQLKELINKYQPYLLFTDGEWSYPSKVWHSCEFLAWLFNKPYVKDTIVVNDRWGKETRSKHGGYYTTEYGEVGFEKNLKVQHKWEESRAIGNSFGYNRNESLADYLTEKQVIELLVDTVSKGGNLNLNIGPTADGLIPLIMEERLLQLGNWLNINGEAIYGTRKWHLTREENIYYTRKEDSIYAICLHWPGKEVIIKKAVKYLDFAEKISSIKLLGYSEKLKYIRQDKTINIKVPSMAQTKIHINYGYVFKITVLE